MSKAGRSPRFPLSLDRVAPRAKPAGPSDAAVLRPQRPLSEAAQQAAHQAAGRHQPAGVGLDSRAVRLRMVQRLRESGSFHEAVLQAMAEVERHHFVDTALVAQAYEDTSLPIGLGQTISKPSVVARMLSLLMEGEQARAVGNLGRVLEIGTGCGYQAALLGRLGRQVISVERLQGLHELARERLRDLRGDRIRLVWGDGRLGHPPNAPYDSIIAAAGGEQLPEAWLEQLAVGGRLVAPVHHEASAGHVLMIVDRTPQGVVHRIHEAVHFVPLKSGAE